jgi:hypothetical protein
MREQRSGEASEQAVADREGNRVRAVSDLKPVEDVTDNAFDRALGVVQPLRDLGCVPAVRQQPQYVDLPVTQVRTDADRAGRRTSPQFVARISWGTDSQSMTSTNRPGLPRR